MSRVKKKQVPPPSLPLAVRKLRVVNSAKLKAVTADPLLSIPGQRFCCNCQQEVQVVISRKGAFYPGQGQAPDTHKCSNCGYETEADYAAYALFTAEMNAAYWRFGQMLGFAQRLTMLNSNELLDLLYKEAGKRFSYVEVRKLEDIEFFFPYIKAMIRQSPTQEFRNEQ